MPGKLILALDVTDEKEAYHIIDEVGELVEYFKVGSVLYTLSGNKIIDYLKKRDKKVFLDLKFFDIPNTVKNASKVASDIGVYMFTIHLLGGSEMISASVEGVKMSNSSNPPLILGVTLLTSLNDEILNRELMVNLSLSDMILHLAEIGYSNGIRGFVCSPFEIKLLRNRFGEDVTLVTPGIRPTGTEWGDQKRVMTPQEAIRLGADYIVMGRSLIDSKDRLKVIENLLDSIK